MIFIKFVHIENYKCFEKILNYLQLTINNFIKLCYNIVIRKKVNGHILDKSIDKYLEIALNMIEKTSTLSV